MKPLICAILIIYLSLLHACSKSTPEATDNGGTDKTEFKTQSATISLKECKNISFDNDQLKLCLDSVSDSRCPMNVNCIWAGIAIIKLSFTKNERLYPVVLATSAFAPYQQKLTIAGYTITLINVTPYPIAPPDTTPIEPIKAEIEISSP